LIGFSIQELAYFSFLLFCFSCFLNGEENCSGGACFSYCKCKVVCIPLSALAMLASPLHIVNHAALPLAKG